METKAPAVLTEQVPKAVAAAIELRVDSQESYNVAADVLSRIKQVQKMVAERKDAVLKPLNAALKAQREQYAPLEAEAKRAEEIVKTKMVIYHNKIEEQRQKAEAEERRLQAEADRKARADKVDGVVPKVAAAPVEITKPAPVKTAAKEVYRKVRKMKITNLEKVPAEYFMVDEVRLRKDALAKKGLGELIPGTEVYEETELAGKAR